MRKLFAVLSGLAMMACTAPKSDNPFPELTWVDNVGAHSYPSSEKVFVVNDYEGVRGDALTLCTEGIQRAIDECAAAGGGVVTFNPGVYLVGSLFVKSNVDFNVPRGTTLIASQDLADYEKIPTRVAGIEMTWPAAIINIVEAENAAISGEGTINGRGKPFWDKYWSMRRDDYEPRGLRWAVDYDCERPRGILVQDCKNVTVKDIVLYQPGFWSLHVLYSQYVTVDNVIISNNIEGRGPSTDGIDIDSSCDVLVQNCNINCNDDNFCLKAGRDADGLRVNRPCERVVIRNCESGHGGGLITCGSETSGMIRDIVAYNLKAKGTGNGLRLKSTTIRGGGVMNVYMADVEMDGVRQPFAADLDWNPSYSYSVLPEEFEGKEIPEHWYTLLGEVDPEQGIPVLGNFHLKNITAVNAGTCISAIGIEKSQIDNVRLENVKISGRTAGAVTWANDWVLDNVEITAEDGTSVVTENCTGVAF